MTFWWRRWTEHVFLEEDRGVAERASGLGLGFVQERPKLAGLRHDAHPASAAAEGRLDDQRKSDLPRGLQRAVAVGERLVGAGQGGHADPRGEGAGGGFVAHHLEQVRTGADERDPRAFAGARELGVLAEEPVAGMDRLDPFLAGQRDNPFDVEIGGDGPFALADEVGFVGLEAVHAEPVLLREDRDGADAQFGRGAEDADGDLRSIRRHDLPEEARALRRGGFDCGSRC
jgi:hypothetical protein